MGDPLTYISFAIIATALIYLWLLVDKLFYKEMSERKKAQAEMFEKVSTIGNELNLLTLRHKNLAIKQSRSIHLHLHEETSKPSKGLGKSALIPKSKSSH